MAESFFEPADKSQSQGFTLDFKRVLSRAIRFWYVIVLCLVISLTIAFYKTRYSQRIYPISASIVIRETQETGGAELLYKNSLIDPYRNYLNEPYIIKSYPLIETVLNKLNYNASFYREGYFLTSDAYSYMPVQALWCNPAHNRSGTFTFRLENENQYTLVNYGSDDEQMGVVYQLGDTISFNGFSICVTKFSNKDIKSYIDIPFILEIKSTRSLAASYIARLNVEWAEEGAGVINLSINGTNSDREIDFLNGLISTYAQLDLDKKNETAQRTISFIESQLLNITDSLRTVEFQLERFGNSRRIKDMSEEAQRLFEKIQGIETQQAELMIRANYFDYLQDYFAKSDQTFNQVILPTAVGISDPVISSLLTRMMDLQLEMKLYVNPKNDVNPLISSKANKLMEIKNEIKEAIKTLRSTDKIKSTFLSKQIETIEKQLSLLPSSERQLIAVQRNYSLLENLYVFLMQKLSEASISEASNTSDIVTVNPPMKGTVLFPKPIQNYTIGIVVGLLVPLVAFIFFEFINSKVQSKEDIDKFTSIPFIGGLGHNKGNTNLTVKERPKSGLAESFRALRSNLNFFTGNGLKKVFMVTSSISGEGKTFTTINLATVFAMSGKRTLIVGADMRRPKIFQDFNRSNDQGLSTYLSGISDFEHVVQSTEIENLFMVSGGPVPPNPSELLLTNKFEDFIKKSLEVFDFVLIDTPPLALVTDAFVMSKFVDHTVFVMRQNYSPRDFVRSIDDYYKSGKIKNISILLNDIYKSGLGYGYGQSYDYAYHYGYSYGYHSKSRGESYYED